MKKGCSPDHPALITALLFTGPTAVLAQFGPLPSGSPGGFGNQDNGRKKQEFTGLAEETPKGNVSVDLDGNISLRSSQNIRVLISNKPSIIVASIVADAPQTASADTIKSVEVITRLSAKYDAEGAAGVINLITIKNTLHGLTRNMDAG